MGADAIPPEPLKEQSVEVAIGGFCLLLGLLVLIIVIVNAKGRDQNGTPDAFNQTVRLREISQRFRLTYSPSKFLPSKREHKAAHSRYLYKFVWGVLVSWLTLTGIYLIVAALVKEIEVFRARQHLVAASCIGSACVFCAAWMLIVRAGALTDEERTQIEACIRRARDRELERAEGIEGAEGDQQTPSTMPLASMNAMSSAHRTWLAVAAFVQVVAWVLSAVAVFTLQAYTLPGPQLATRILTAPGYGLFSGWMLYAAFVGMGMSSAIESYGDAGTSEVLSEHSRMYNGSVLIVVAAVLAATVGSLVPDPTVPLPMLIVTALFVPGYTENRIACAICALGGLFSVVRVFDCLSADPVWCARWSAS